jgi:hypothetical protein
VEETTTTGIRNTLKNSENHSSEKYHSDKTDRLFQNWQECWLSERFNNWDIEEL